MANTYYQMYVQTVFPVKYRKATLHESWRPELFAVIGSLINETGCKTIIVNGTSDHVHCFFGIKPVLAVSDVMKSVKAKSTKWVNESQLLKHRFEWQPSFRCFITFEIRRNIMKSLLSGKSMSGCLKSLRLIMMRGFCFVNLFD